MVLNQSYVCSATLYMKKPMIKQRPRKKWGLKLKKANKIFASIEIEWHMIR